MKTLRTFFHIIATCVLFASCQSDMPEGVLDKGEMEEILYDYHLAKAMGDEGGKSLSNQSETSSEAIAAVFDKHGITEQKFQKSMEWYSAHPEDLFEVYKKIEKDMPSGSLLPASGVSASVQSGTDTVVVWSGKPFNILSTANNPYLSLHIDLSNKQVENNAGNKDKGKSKNANKDADNTYKYTLRFTPEWYVREGSRNAVVGLTMHYSNDSTDYVTYNSYGSGIQTIELPSRQGWHPVSIEGFVYITGAWSERPQILNIISPVIYRLGYRQSNSEAASDSLKVDSARLSNNKRINLERNLRDSLLRDDSVRKRRPHFRQ